MKKGMVMLTGIGRMPAGTCRARREARAAWTDRGDHADWTDWAARTDWGDHADHADRGDHADWEDRTARTDWGDHADHADWGDHADWTDRAARTDWRNRMDRTAPMARGVLALGRTLALGKTLAPGRALALGRTLAPGRTLVLALMLVLATGCGGKDAGSGPGKDDADSKPQEETLYECFQDPSMENGVWLLAPKDGKRVPVEAFRLGKGTADPVWDLCQWNNRHDLAGTKPVETKYGTTFSNGVHTFARDAAGAFTMILDASKEYDAPRTDGPWPHMLVQTSFGRIPLKGLKKLELTFDERILSVENRMGADFDPNRHTAQALFYFSIANRNSSSAWNNKSIWLGVAAWDWRGGLMKQPTVSFDKGTATYIYQMASEKTFSGADLTDGKWHTCRVDVLQAVRDAVAGLKEHGEFTDASADDFTLSEMNFGWEMPGTFYGALQVRNFSLQSDVKVR